MDMTMFTNIFESMEFGLSRQLLFFFLIFFIGLLITRNTRELMGILLPIGVVLRMVCGLGISFAILGVFGLLYITSIFTIKPIADLIETGYNFAIKPAGQQIYKIPGLKRLSPERRRARKLLKDELTKQKVKHHYVKGIKGESDKLLDSKKLSKGDFIPDVEKLLRSSMDKSDRAIDTAKRKSDLFSAQRQVERSERRKVDLMSETRKIKEDIIAWKRRRSDNISKRDYISSQMKSLSSNDLRWNDMEDDRRNVQNSIRYINEQIDKLRNRLSRLSK